MQITRRDLYELVSNSPLSKVAPSLGISATTLAGICREREVPYPGSGYWTRKSLGQVVNLEPLPASSESETQSINIEPKKVRVRPARARVVHTAAETGGAGDVSTANAASKIEERPIKLHPIIAKWLADQEQRRREAKASRDPWRVKMAPGPLTDVDRRRHGILNKLFHSLESKGAKISEADKGLLRVTIEDQKIDFQVREKNRQVRLSKENGQNSYRSQELVGTGKLLFAIRTYLRGPHNEEWPETDRSPLESQLPKMVERFFEGAKILKAWHVEQEQERERWRQEAARREERVRLAKQEENRRERLGQLAYHWQTANLIRDFIAEIKSKPFDADKDVDGKTLAQWLVWAEAAIATLDLTREGPESIFSIIGSVK